MRFVIVAVVTFLLAACGMTGPKREPIPLVPQVDLPRFMGAWYVIGNIPLPPEKQAYNPVETYTLKPDGSIATTFRMRKGGFDAKPKEYHPTGYVVEGTNNALWGMQFIWPFKGEYRIVYLEPDYSVTIVARNKRDYVWLMSRTPVMNDADYARYSKLIAGMGYDVSTMRRVPQKWPE